ncbi:MAG: LysM peptidoglycan-binding domain-containing protein, partial [Sideroxyarcus sp.]|nr:LysM peptidoglycan-binding domain-containing protein [Sideroxyarcus sp.]
VATLRATSDPSGTGSFGFRPANDLAPGRHTIYAVAVSGNRASHNSPETVYTVQAPFIGITFLDARLIQDHPEPYIAFKGIGAGGSRVDFYLNGEFLDRIGLLNGHDSVEHFTYKLYANNLVPKEYTLYAIAYDDNGKPSRTSNVVSFTKTSDVAASILVTSLGSAPVPQQTPAPLPLPTVIGPGPGGTYTVQRGDSLWRIAQDQVGDGSRYGELVVLNQDTHPELLVNPGSISTGWILRLP